MKRHHHRALGAPSVCCASDQGSAGGGAGLPTLANESRAGYAAVAPADRAGGSR